MPRKYVQWHPRWNAGLGTAPDGQLAKKWGVSVAAVRLHRIAMGIAPAKKKPVPCSHCGKTLMRWRPFCNVRCEDCYRQAKQQWHDDHRAERNAKRRERYHTEANLKEYINNWKKQNTDKVREYHRRSEKKCKAEVESFLNSLPCDTCGMHHTQELRDRILRRMLPCTTQELHEAWECIWGPCGNQYRNTAGAMMLSRDLKRIGAWTPKVGTGHYELPRAA